MLGMFVEMLPTRPDDDPKAVSAMLFDDMMKLNGKQTIYQMIQFAERVKERGAAAKEPLWYKHEYLNRLERKIGSRIEQLRNEPAKADDHLVFGSRPLLENLRRRG